eukprot:gb/GECG01014524.1/.p1 GENE.gb/GECG01014524.1/~~gb/GECG01014524.1/.p1  ORF type:complete len:562 (+),score=46.31 gb/GECG01014524.1/:1-1686(+)
MLDCCKWRIRISPDAPSLLLQRQVYRMQYQHRHCSYIPTTWREDTKPELRRTVLAGSLSEIIKALPQHPRTNRWSIETYIDVKAKKEIVDFMEGNVALLSTGRMGGAGSSSKLLFGEKGIGKSNALICSARAIALKFPSVIPIYYSFDSDDIRLPNELLSEALHADPEITKYAFDRSLNRKDDERQASEKVWTLAECERLLVLHNKYAVFMIDEVDQVYRSLANRRRRERLVAQLIRLGSMATHTMYTLICGSSANLPILINKHMVYEHRELKEEFPLVKCVESLNGKKYSRYRISQGIFESWEVSEVVRGMGLGEKEHDIINVLLYCSGVNLRNIRNGVNAMMGSRYKELTDLCQHPAEWDERAARTYRPLIEELYATLVEKNKDILSSVSKGATLEDRLEAVKTVPWYRVIKSLTPVDIEQCLQKANAAGGHNWGFPDVYHLIDTNFLCGPPRDNELGLLAPSPAVLHQCYLYPNDTGSYEATSEDAQSWRQFVSYSLINNLDVSFKAADNASFNVNVSIPEVNLRAYVDAIKRNVGSYADDIKRKIHGVILRIRRHIS